MVPRKVWMRGPHIGGKPVPAAVQLDTKQRILEHAAKFYAGRYTRIDVRFRGVFCYIDAYCEPDPPTQGLLDVFGETEEQYYKRLRAVPIHLCRMRYFGDQESWSVAFYTYSNERYEESFFAHGGPYGTPEDALAIGAVYLQ